MRKGEIESRFDAIYYNIANTLEVANKTIYPTKKLANIAILQRGRFSHRPRNAPQFYGGEYPFIQTGDVVKASQNNDKIVFTQTLNELGLTVSRLFQPRILVFTIAANIGDTAILDYPACFPDSLITITPKTSETSIDYLNIYFKLIKPYLEGLAPQAAQKNINLQQLSPTRIVIPPIEVQTRIIEKFEAAYRAKRAKETEAKNLLDGIDAYLLERLGIETPAATDAKRFFYRRLNEVTGNRFDANSYNAERLAAIEAVKSGKYSFGKLKSLTDFSKTIVSETDLPYIGMENIEGNTGNYIETSEKESFGSAVVFSEHQILFPKLRPYLNKVYYAEFDGVCSTEFHILDSKTEDLTNEFLSHFLRSRTIVSQTKHLMSGNTLPRLQTEDIENLLIPLPPLAVQEEIAAHVQAIRQQAKELKHEAKQTVKLAKQEVERMILG